MTLTLKNFGKYLAFFLLLAMVFRTFGELFVLFASLFFGIVLLGFIIARKLKIGATGTVIYLFLFFGVINYLMETSLYDFIFPFFMPFFPMFFLHYLIVVNKRIPGDLPFFIMLLGFFVSIIYQTIHGRGTYNLPVFGDQWIIFEFIFFFFIYMLFSLRILSLWKVIIVITLSTLLEIVFILLKYVFSGLAGYIFLERFGSSVGLTSNQIAVWLDITFPLALFIGLYDKRPRIKKTFLVIAAIYGAVILLTACRSTLISLPLIPFFIASHTKSTSLKIAVVVISLAATAVFGRGTIERAFLPSRADQISSLGRVELIKGAYATLKENYFLFGIGIDNFKTEKYNYGFMRSFDPDGAMSSHNGFLEIWLGWGLIGFIGWLMFLGQCALRALRAPLRPEMAYLRPALLLAMTCSLMHSVFDSVIACFPFMIFFLTLCACISYLFESEEVCLPLTEKKAALSIPVPQSLK